MQAILGIPSWIVITRKSYKIFQHDQTKHLLESQFFERLWTKKQMDCFIELTLLPGQGKTQTVKDLSVEAGVYLGLHLAVGRLDVLIGVWEHILGVCIDWL